MLRDVETLHGEVHWWGEGEGKYFDSDKLSDAVA